MEEAKRFIDLFNKYNSVTYFGETSRVHLMKFSERVPFSNIAQFDKPDIVIESDDFFYFFEYFKFDSTKNNKKGSSIQQENAKIQRDFKEKARKAIEEKNKKSVMYRATYTSNRTKEDYISNFIDVFRNHYNKLESYKINAKVSELKKEYEFGFIIENSSILPDFVLNDNRKPQIVIPIYFVEIIKIFKESKDVKNIFYITPNGNSGYHIFYFRNCEALFNELEKLDISQFDDRDIINWKPHTIGVTEVITKEEILEYKKDKKNT